MKRAFAFAFLVACGGDDGGGSGLSCDLVPTCYQTAIEALHACVTTPDLTLGTPVDMSGTVSGLMCTGGDQSVTFSTFSTSPNGTVPLPSTTTLMNGGTVCATLKRSTVTGTATADKTTIEIPGATEVVAVNHYDNGDIGIECGPAEIVASSSELADCADQIVKPDVFRDDTITMMGVELVDASGASTPLFTCTR